MVEVIAANDALEQEWRMSLAGRRAKGKDASIPGGASDTGAEPAPIENPSPETGDGGW